MGDQGFPEPVISLGQNMQGMGLRKSLAESHTFFSGE